MFRKSLLVIVALLLLASFASSGRARADGTPTPDHTLDTSGDSHDHGERIDVNGAAVKIIDPDDGEVLRQPFTIVRVETTNWPLGEAGHHFHLYVNGKEQGMSPGNSSALPVHDLLPGENTIEVVLSNERHQELNATDKITVRFEGGGAAVAAPTLSTGVVFVLLGIAVVVLAILGIGYVVTRKKA